jgi:hypothetical protein
MTTKERTAYRKNRKPGEGPRACDLLPGVPKATGQTRAPVALLKAEVAGSQFVHQLENAPTAACHAGERVIRNDDGEAGLLGQELVDIAQQRATAGENDAALGDVRRR